MFAFFLLTFEQEEQLRFYFAFDIKTQVWTKI